MATKSEQVVKSLNKTLKEYFKVPLTAQLDRKNMRVNLVDPELNTVLSLGSADGTRETCSYRQNILGGDLTSYRLTAELVSSFLINGHAALTNLSWEKDLC